MILNLAGNADGIPREAAHTAGIYLDELSSGITVSGNTVAFTTYGIQLHNAARNQVDAHNSMGIVTINSGCRRETRRTTPQARCQAIPSLTIPFST